MDLDKNLMEVSQLTLLCLSIGKEKEQFTRAFIATLNEKFSRVFLSTFCQAEIREKSKQSFPLKVSPFCLLAITLLC